jgi:SAM-dependent methyltransferase
MVRDLARKVTNWLDARRTSGRSPTGMPLPPARFRMGGSNFESDDAFIEGGRKDARRLVKLADLGSEKSVLDFGCGSGRLAVGLIEELGGVQRYVGFDVQRHLIHWAQSHIVWPGFSFVGMDAPNARYRPNGKGARAIPVYDTFDVAYAYSVFSHMQTDDVRSYLREFKRLLNPGGRAFFTAFVEDGVPQQTVNPDRYGSVKWEGPLHCVRFSREWFDSLVDELGFKVQHVEHGSDTDGQSLYVVVA